MATVWYVLLRDMYKTFYPPLLLCTFHLALLRFMLTLFAIFHSIFGALDKAETIFKKTINWVYEVGYLLSNVHISIKISTIRSIPLFNYTLNFSTSIVYLNCLPQFFTSTHYLNSLPRLSISILYLNYLPQYSPYLNYLPQLSTSILYLNSLPQYSTSIICLNSLPQFSTSFFTSILYLNSLP